MRKTKRRPAMLESLERRQLAAVDLVVADVEFDQPTEPIRTAEGRRLTGRILVQNGGLTTCNSSFFVNIFAEDHPNAPQEQRTELLTMRVSPPLKFAHVATVEFVIVLPELRSYDVDDNERYLSVHLDRANQVAESNESNNSYRAEGTDYLRFRAEENLTVLPGQGGGRNVVPYTKWEFFPWAGKIGDENIGGADMDVFAVDLTNARIMEIGLRDTTFDGAIRVYDANWNLLASNDNNPIETKPSDPYVRIPTGGGGRHYVVVSSSANFGASPFNLDGRVHGATGDYTLYEAVYQTPTVTVGPATTGTIYENSGDAGQGGFTVHRTGPTSRPLRVPFDFTGTAGRGSDVNVANEVIIPAGASSAWVPMTAVNDTLLEGAEYLQVSLRSNQTDYWIGSPNLFAMTVRDNPQQTGPRAVLSYFGWNDRFGQRLVVQFDDQIAGYEASDIEVRNTTTGQLVTQKRALTSGDTAILFFDAGLADGNYRATFKANTITNLQGGPNNFEHALDFFMLKGDANHDRRVNFSDLVILAQNYNKRTGMNYSNGDFDYDGDVDFGDLVKLAQNYNAQLATPAPLTTSPSTAFSTHTKRFIAELL